MSANPRDNLAGILAMQNLRAFLLDNTLEVCYANYTINFLKGGHFMKRFVLCLAVTALLLTCLLPTFSFADDSVRILSGAQVYEAFENSQNSVKEVFKSSTNTSLPYRLYVPDDYDPNKSYPLVLFFHGAGERGTDNKAQISAGSVMQRLLTETEQKRFPCLILAPQCAGDSKWVLSDWGPGTYDHTKIKVSPYMKAAEELLAKVVDEYSVDKSRLYVTGMSMGGYGTWDIISRNPDMFAAAFPVCGGVDESYLDALQGFPIWTFHNNGDTIVSSKGTKLAYEKLQSGGAITYTEYKSTAHDAWTAAYSTATLMNWVFTKSAKTAVTYPDVENVTLEGPSEIVRGGTLTFKYAAEAGFEVTSLTVGGEEITLTNAAKGSVSIPEYVGGEIKLTVGEAKVVEPIEPDNSEQPGVDDLDPEPAIENDSMPGWVIPVAVAAAVLVLIVIVLLVLKKKK